MHVSTKKWLFTKVSSIILIPLMTWFIINFISIYDKDYQEVVLFFTNQPSKIIFTIFIVTAFFFSALTISEIFEDYITNKSQADILRAEEEAKLLDDLTSGMIETESGLKYKVFKKGSGPNAKIDDVLSVHYSLKLIDGSEIDSSFTRGEPIEFTCGVGQVIKGWDEAMQLLNKGSKATLVIPSELGYGSTGAGNGVIPPNAILIFEVELVDIK